MRRANSVFGFASGGFASTAVRAAATLASGCGLILFPEGTRTRTGLVGPFRPGALRLAAELGVPLVPVSQAGAFELRDGRFVAARVGANHFQLRRIDGRWQITKRIIRGLDGRSEARELLSDGVAGRTR